MKKFITLAVALISAITAVFAAGCGNDVPADTGDGTLPTTEIISIYVPDGAPALSIAKFINDNENFGTDYTIEYNIVAASAINNAIISNKADMVIMPVNDATKIYKQTDNGVADYVMAAVITHGNFYVMSKGNISSVNDLIGKVVFVPMRGKVPDLTFQAALKTNGIEYEESGSPKDGKVAIKYYNQPSDYLAILKQNESAVGLVPEPAATTANSKMGINYVLDVQELFDSQAKAYPQAVLMVKKTTAEKNQELITEIADAFAQNVSWVINNVSEAVETIKGKFTASTLDAATLKASSVEKCKIYWQDGVSAKTAVENYIAKIREVDVNSAKTVDDGFFL